MCWFTSPFCGENISHKFVLSLGEKITNMKFPFYLYRVKAGRDESVRWKLWETWKSWERAHHLRPYLQCLQCSPSGSQGGNKTYCIFPVPRALNRYLRWAVLFLLSQFLYHLQFIPSRHVPAVYLSLRGERRHVPVPPCTVHICILPCELCVPRALFRTWYLWHCLVPALFVSVQYLTMCTLAVCHHFEKRLTTVGEELIIHIWEKPKSKFANLPHFLN